MRKEDINRFVQWMQDQDLWVDFAHELKETRKMTPEQYFAGYRNSPKDLIFHAFPWQGTKAPDVGSQNFWRVADKKWVEYLESSQG